MPDQLALASATQRLSHENLSLSNLITTVSYIFQSFLMASQPGPGLAKRVVTGSWLPALKTLSAGRCYSVKTILLKMTREFSDLRRALKRVPVVPLIGCSFFVLAGLAFLPLLGIEADEALFANILYKPHGGGYTYRLGGAELPLMVLSYLGALKSWIYGPIFWGFWAGG